jgi:hypothetical protein
MCAMKKYLSILILLALIVTFKQASAQISEIDDAVIGFFEASKNGDVEKMKTFIGGPFYDKRRSLLEKNKGYPTYLIKYYKGIEIYLLNTVMGDEHMVKKDYPELFNRYDRAKAKGNYSSISADNSLAVVLIRYRLPDGNSYDSKLLLKKFESESWKIIEEIRVK